MLFPLLCLCALNANQAGWWDEHLRRQSNLPWFFSTSAIGGGIRCLFFFGLRITGRYLRPAPGQKGWDVWQFAFEPPSQKERYQLFAWTNATAHILTRMRGKQWKNICCSYSFFLAQEWKQLVSPRAHLYFAWTREKENAIFCIPASLLCQVASFFRGENEGFTVCQT